MKNYKPKTAYIHGMKIDKYEFKPDNAWDWFMYNITPFFIGILVCAAIFGLGMAWLVLLG